jgi:hypothetical protein
MVRKADGDDLLKSDNQIAMDRNLYKSYLNVGKWKNSSKIGREKKRERK